uniref:POU domain protein n=1 Tax=Scleropages formosus TaxID=113540 RepID=A0A8C9RYL5_SCLFO
MSDILTISLHPMIAGQLSKSLLTLCGEMSAAELRGDDNAATPDSENEPPLLPLEATDNEDPHSTLCGECTRGYPPTPILHSNSPFEQTHPTYSIGRQSMLATQHLASAVAGVMPAGTSGLNQPILIPFSVAGQLGGQQSLVLSLTGTNPTNLGNLQGLVAAAAGGIMTVPLQNLQATSSLNSQLQQFQQLQHLQQHQQHHQHKHQHQHQEQPGTHIHIQSPLSPPHQQSPVSQQQISSSCSSSSSSSAHSFVPPNSPHHKQNHSPAHNQPSPSSPPTPLQLNPLATQAVAAVAAMSSMTGSQTFGNALSGLQGITGQLVTNAQGQIIGTIPMMSNSTGPSSQSGGGAPGLQIQPITPQLLTNAQGQIIATVIGNQILPVINTQGITLSPIKPGQQVKMSRGSSQTGLLNLNHGQTPLSHSPIHRVSSSSSSSSSTSTLSVGQLVSNPQTAPGEVDGVNLEEIREFAKAFKIRRLSLGLTQTQVGQALSATEGPAYSQSAICRHTILRSHFFLPQEAQENTISSSLTAKLNPGLLYPARFEKLDITPKSAQKIKPVLERWMAEAEARHRSGTQNLTDFIGSEPSKKRKRRTSFTPQALEILNSHFEKNTHPSGLEMTEIAEKLNYDREVIRVWFCNKRQALKNTIKRLKQPDLGPTAPMDPLTDSVEEHP